MVSKSIENLVSDIEGILTNGIPSDTNSEIFEQYGKDLATVLTNRLDRTKREFTLRMSNIGAPCVRKLWLEKNYPEDKIPFEANTFYKFRFGDIIEEDIIFLAALAGHRVEGRQKESEIAGIKGHRDVVIDGVLIDVKSCSPYSFIKFKEHLTPEKDSFGYITQLLSYLEDAQTDDIVLDKTRAAFLAVDKQNGSFCLDFHERDPEFDWVKFYEERKAIVDGDVLPDRAFKAKPDGYKNKATGMFVPNGNEFLDIECSYCDMKHKCWDNIRTFIRSGRPVYFTKVVKEPKLYEIR